MKIQWLKEINEKEVISRAKKLLSQMYGTNGIIYHVGATKNKQGKYIPAPPLEALHLDDADADGKLSRYYADVKGRYIKINKIDIAKFKASGRKIPGKDDVSDFRFAFIDCDKWEDGKEVKEEEMEAFLEHQREVIDQMNLPAVAIIYSGNKSYHIWLKLDASNLEEWHKRLSCIWAYADSNGYYTDKNCKNPETLTRFPCSGRDDKKQYVAGVINQSMSFQEWFLNYGSDYKEKAESYYQDEFGKEKKTNSKKQESDTVDLISAEPQTTSCTDWDSDFTNDVFWNSIKNDVLQKQPFQAEYNDWINQIETCKTAGYTLTEYQLSGLLDNKQESIQKWDMIQAGQWTNSLAEARKKLVSKAQANGYVLPVSNAVTPAVRPADIASLHKLCSAGITKPQTVSQEPQTAESSCTVEQTTEQIQSTSVQALVPMPNPFSKVNDKITFNPAIMQEYIVWAGFRPYYDETNDVQWVKVNGKIITPFREKAVKNEIGKSVKNNFSADEYIYAMDKIIKQSIYNGIQEISVNTERDTPERISFYFRNGIADVYKNEVKIRPLDSMEGYIWEDTIASLQYDYTIGSDDGIVKQFFIDVTSDADGEELKPNPDRLKSLMSAVGYFLSTYRKRGEEEAIYLTDKKSSYDEDGKSTGRTGKGLIVQAMSKMRYIGSKDMKKEKRDFRLSGYKKGMTGYVYQDIPATCSTKEYYNDITEEQEVEHKGKDIETLKFKDGFKICFTANHIPKDMGEESSLGRYFIVALENIFNSQAKPEQKYGKRFFDETWDDAEWNLFFNFMINCAKVYLQYGLVKYNDTEMQQKILMAGVTNQSFKDFIEKWMETNKFKLDGTTELKRDEIWKEYDKNCNENFIKFRLSNNTFQKNLTNYFAGGWKSKHTESGNVWFLDISKTLHRQDEDAPF